MEVFFVKLLKEMICRIAALKCLEMAKPLSNIMLSWVVTFSQLSDNLQMTTSLLMFTVCFIGLPVAITFGIEAESGEGSQWKRLHIMWKKKKLQNVKSHQQW